MSKKPLEIETLRHREAKRLNIPTVEYEGVLSADDLSPVQVAYQRRNRDLDPQLVWRGKDEQDWSDLVVTAPPLYIQEKVHPKVLIEDLKRETGVRRQEGIGAMADLFGDFNGLEGQKAATEFYQHDQNWSNRMISGDSLAVMASLAEREGLRGKVQSIYIDPPYGIKFNSNFQWSTTSRDVKDGVRDHMSREPEQVRAFRDTWRDGIHSYLTYLRDRLMVARDMLLDSGSIFVQISDENIHRVRSIMDEVFGEDNFVSLITYYTSGGRSAAQLPTTSNFLIWYSKNKEQVKFRRLFREKPQGGLGSGEFSWITFPGGESRRLTRNEHENPEAFPQGGVLCIPSDMTSSHEYIRAEISHRGMKFRPGNRYWSTSVIGIKRLEKSDRIIVQGKTLRYKRLLEDFPYREFDNIWSDTAARGFFDDKVYVVQTGAQVIQRCILMTTDPGDLVLDPTCGSGTTAYVAEQWGRRWIMIDTSRVAIALARSRIMGARYPYYILADSQDGQRKEGEVNHTAPKTSPVRNDIRSGFVYERASRVIMKDIANNAEIDVIYDKWQQTLEPLRSALNAGVGKSWDEWELPRAASAGWSADAKSIHAKWWEARIARQKEIDASIAAKADSEYLYDKPYVDNGKVRVSGPFTVESLSPHRTLIVGADDELIDSMKSDQSDTLPSARDATVRDFVQMILENLQTAGVQQMAKADKISFVSLSPWAGGGYICAEGTYIEGDDQRRAGIVVGPEFGSVSRADLVGAAKEAGEAGFDVLIACAFNFDAAATEFDRLGRIPVLKARMNPDLMMAKDLKTTAHGNLFVVFGEPDIKIHNAKDGLISVQVFGVDVFKPQTGEVVSAGIDGIALWMIDTDYNEESFFVRHAYFLGANDPYKSLKTTLKAEIDEAAWSSLNSATSRPFSKPKNGRIAVKVINHLGDEVMKVVNVR